MVHSVDEMEEDYIILDSGTPETFEKARKLLKEGWVKSDLTYNPFGTELTRLLHIIKYTEEELAEIEAIKQKRISSPRPPIDENCLTVPIISYADEQARKENPYKILAAQGYREVHRTSSVAVMKLTDPRGIMLSDDDLAIILKSLEGYTIDHPMKSKIDALHYQLSEILKASEEAKLTSVEAQPDPQPESTT